MAVLEVDDGEEGRYCAVDDTENDMEIDLGPVLQYSSLPVQKDKLLMPTSDDKMKPHVGMSFKSIADGYKFYGDYAKSCGFKQRLSSSAKRKHTGVIRRKYICCNKNGQNPDIPNKRKYAVTRTGCGALIVLQISDDESEYFISSFIEEHNHAMASPAAMVHLRGNRAINAMHKNLILANSRVNQGPSRTYKMIKEYVRGFKYVGASLVDFKNFMRDLKKYIKDYDAQILIEKFMLKKSMSPSFFFDFDVDKEGRLNKVFWCDPISKKNYSLFGDMVSFDTTFKKNKYCMVFAPFTGVDHHRKCVTFAAGLIATEDKESFKWLFTNFLEAMDSKHPVCLITDQDIGMKAAIPEVFDMSQTRHRLCMWHIMKKVPEKLGSEFCKDSGFLEELCEVVWSSQNTPLQFETEWERVLNKYAVADHEWLKGLYDIRKSWIPAYYRDLFMGAIMRTTSLSESENSFFSNFTNPHITLTEFLLRFESAMDGQRWIQSRLIAVSKNSSPRVLTPLLFEKAAVKFYTPAAFYKFQEELRGACFSCGVDYMHYDEVGITTVQIRDHVLDRVINVCVSNCRKLKCECKMFEREGILCRHALFVAKSQGWPDIPEEYLLKRWSIDAMSKPVFDAKGYLLEECALIDQTDKQIGSLWSEMFGCVALAEGNSSDMDELLELLKNFSIKLESQGRSTKQVVDKKKQMESLLGCTIPSEVVVKPPKVSANKGSGKGGRIVSQREKAIENSHRHPRLCSNCDKHVYHDFRNCPEPKKPKV